MAELARRDNLLVGTWKLLSFHYEFDDADERDEPFGPEPVGYLVITEERLITLMTARERVTDAAARELLDSMLAIQVATGCKAMIVSSLRLIARGNRLGSGRSKFVSSKSTGNIVCDIIATRSSEVPGTAPSWCGRLAEGLERTNNKAVRWSEAAERALRSMVVGLWPLPATDHPAVKSPRAQVPYGQN
jgi:Lipocalin-like domain